MKLEHLHEDKTTPKVKWEISSAPTGKYRSFNKRGWPSAHYSNGNAALRISCEDSYRPADAKSGEHKPLKVYIADWSTRDKDPNAAAFEWKKLKGEFATLKDAKAAGEKAIAQFKEFWPKNFQVAEGQIVKDPKSDNPYIAKLRHITPEARRDPRKAYLKQLADDFDVPLKKIEELSDMLGHDEDFDALLIHVNEISDPGK